MLFSAQPFCPNLKFVGKEILLLETIDSTNTLCLQTPSLLEKEGLVVVAKRQTQGRGKQDRVWDAGKGAHLFCSFVIRLPSNMPVYASHYSIWTGLATKQALTSLGVQDACIKWPNDILLHNKKVCGILCEQTRTKQDSAVIIAGIGVNLSGNKRQFAAALQSTATTIEEETNLLIMPLPLAKAIAFHLDRILQDVFQNKTEELACLWNESSSSIGKAVTWQEDGKTKQGYIQGLRKDGSLLVRDKLTKQEHVFISQEISFI